jgi:outer membrane protein TolC
MSCSLFTLRVGVLSLFVFTSSLSFGQSDALRLDQALQFAQDRAGSIKAAGASVQASREIAVKADQLPDPMLKVGIDNVPVTGEDRYSTTSDFMTMRRVGIEQEWVSSDKRKARAERAQRSIEMEDASYLETVAKVREETAKAWVAVLYAQRKLDLLNSLQKNASDDLSAIKASHRAAGANATDVVQAELVSSLATDAYRKGERDLRTTRTVLSRWTGLALPVVVDETPVLHSHVADLPVDELEKYHPMLLTARRAITLADADSTLASKESVPNWTVEASYAQRGSQYSNMLSVGISIPLTLNKERRQNRDIAEKAALGTKARMDYEEALRELRVEIENLSTTIDSDRERIAALEKSLLPSAKQQTVLAETAYRAGSGSLSAVFAARQNLLNQKMQILELEQEAATAWASLEYHVLPHDMPTSGDAQ